MSRLAPALAIRRRQLDGLRRDIAGRRQQLAGLAAEAAALEAQRSAERRHHASGEAPSDAWFALAARRLGEFAGKAALLEEELSALRESAVDARARLTLLEDAEALARADERRRREQRDQAALDDRTAALWSRRA